MPVSIAKEPDESPFRTREHCCFCFKPTSFWHEPKDVAVCIKCAEIHQDEDVPTKADWCASVRQKFPHLVGNRI